MSRWFRMYDELLDDPKVQMLPGDTFKAWVNMLCLASRNDGFLPDVTAIAFALRLDEKKLQRIVDDLCKRGLIDVAEDRFTPHGWQSRQYKSDVSTDRVRRYREQRRNVSSNVAGNVSPDVSETEMKPLTRAGLRATDTDTEYNSDRSSHSSPHERQGAAGQDFSRDELDRIEGMIFPEVAGLPVALNQDISPIVGCYQRGATDADVVNGIRAAIGSGMRPTRWKAFPGWIDRAVADRTAAPTSQKSQSEDHNDIIARFAAKNGLTPDGQPISN